MSEDERQAQIHKLIGERDRFASRIVALVEQRDRLVEALREAQDALNPWTGLNQAQRIGAMDRIDDVIARVYDVEEDS